MCMRGGNSGGGGGGRIGGGDGVRAETPNIANGIG